MDPLMQTGLTIAFICNGDTHPTVINYHKFGKKYWDDTRQTIGSKIGYYFAYYFQKRFVYIHKIIDIVQPAHRPSCMDWNSDRPILCLSKQLKSFTWDEWIHGPGKNAPYTPTYSMTPTSTWSYSALQQHKKFNTFQFDQFKQIVDKEDLELLRRAKCDQIQILIDEAEKRIKELTLQQVECMNGLLDKELV